MGTESDWGQRQLHKRWGQREAQMLTVKHIGREGLELRRQKEGVTGIR